MILPIDRSSRTAFQLLTEPFADPIIAELLVGLDLETHERKLHICEGDSRDTLRACHALGHLLHGAIPCDAAIARAIWPGDGQDSGTHSFSDPSV